MEVSARKQKSEFMGGICLQDKGAREGSSGKTKSGEGHDNHHHRDQQKKNQRKPGAQ